MTLVVDHDLDGPGLHALVIGASNYSYLPGAFDPPLEGSWNIRSLGAAAIAAAGVAEWFQDPAIVLAKPLKTLRVLLSPTPEESAKMPPWAATVLPPTWVNMKNAIRNWRTACQSDLDNVAVFYFAGHGFSRGRGDNNLLLACSDLFDPDESTLHNTVLGSNVFGGMAPQTLGDHVARQQFFFFDCCRTFPKEMTKFDDRNVAQVLDVLSTEGVRDERAYCRWYAAQDNASAYASIGNGTSFGQAVIDALSHSGRKEHGQGWFVDADAISARLRARYAGVDGQAMTKDDSSPGPLLGYLAAPPDVELDVRLDPIDHAAGRDVGLHEPGLGLLPAAQSTKGVGWHRISVSPGFYDVQIRGPDYGWTELLRGLAVGPEIRNPLVLTDWA